ncbi:MAG: hypothetical protein AVDCRST_MAG72-2405 [uncultured Nocardioidaceae bacterium]|uniref:HTH merR-type domain-containing protein n=1 Tax=uncultured Nocardioidaceae bacterium TaxID=253824 RepID=A0A6J4MLD3_9ACTN|nr:MAG: hypothetical protein AVDCRST_MAG72-2405 [uncultured Nocardioidaceae bacterium]
MALQYWIVGLSNVKMSSMWMSELSERSRLPVATIKFYLREGLLPVGESTGATRAQYDDSHVRRLRLIRALVEVAGLRLDTVRAILVAVDDERLPLHEVVGTAHVRLSDDDAAVAPTDRSRRRVDGLLRRRRWRVAPENPSRAVLARALDSLDELDQPVPDALLDEYAAAMSRTARREISAVAGFEPDRATEMVVVGTVLLEPVLLAIRRLAQTHVSSVRLNRPAVRSR